MSKTPFAAILLLGCLSQAAAAQTRSSTSAAVPPAPARLSDTGLFVAGSGGGARADIWTFAPQYALWSDGASKRRWMALPRGRAIDARNPDAWVFPVGTRFWKEFSVNGQRVETRTLERLARGWRFATYVWNAEGTEAFLAPEEGGPTQVEVAPGVSHNVPSREDCRTCHDDAANPVLGASLLQLSPDRDPHAPHAERHDDRAVDLQSLVARGVLRGLPRALVQEAPRIHGRNETERAALGYLLANCSGCHNGRGALASLGLRFDVPASGDPSSVLASLINRASHFRPADADATLRVAPGRPEASTLYHRLNSRSPLTQMPPLATSLPDTEGLSLLRDWITQLSPTQP